MRTCLSGRQACSGKRDPAAFEPGHAQTFIALIAPCIAQFKFKYAPNPCNPPSLPYPLSLYPPKGEVGSNLL